MSFGVPPHFRARALASCRCCDFVRSGQTSPLEERLRTASRESRVRTCLRNPLALAVLEARWQSANSAMRLPPAITAAILAAPGCFTPSQTLPGGDSSGGSGMTGTAGTTAGGSLTSSTGSDTTAAPGEESTSTTTSSSSNDSSASGDNPRPDVGGSPQTCDEAGGVCVPSPGRPWSTPIVRSADGCERPFSSADISVTAGVEVVPGSCACECGTPLGVCGEATRINHFSNCSNDPIGSNSWPENTCLLDSPSPGLAITPSAVAGELESEGCAGSMAENFPDPTPIGELELCVLDEPIDATCTGQMECVPPPSGSATPGLCVFGEGDLACPEGFAEKTVLYENIVDDRFCPVICECGVSGGTCATNWDVFGDDACAGAALSSETINSGETTCLTPAAGLERYSVLTSVEYVAAECTAPAPLPASGDVFVSDAITVCCTD